MKHGIIRLRKDKEVRSKRDMLSLNLTLMIIVPRSKFLIVMVKKIMALKFLHLMMERVGSNIIQEMKHTISPVKQILQMIYLNLKLIRKLMLQFSLIIGQR